MLLRGGVGEFRGRAPLTLLAARGSGTDLSQQLLCLGLATPFADWPAFASDPALIPTTCLGAVAGTAQANDLIHTQVMSPEFEAPRSIRTSLGFQAQLSPKLSLAADLAYARGTSLYGVTDLNLDTSSPTLLASEGSRPVYGDPASVLASASGVSLAASRVYPEYGHVFEVNSGLSSTTTQLSVSLGGLVASNGFLQASYTFTRSKDESSFSCCQASQGFQNTATSANPNEALWATSNFERSHAFRAIFAHPIGRWADVSLIGQLTSGTPFTPMVGGDVNGDGVLNDAAYLFDPSTTTEPALIAGMGTVLANAPERIVGCLEEQLGGLAARNSCRDGWQASLSLSATVRPGLPGLGDRLSLQLDAMNLLAGADQLFNGDNLNGWGASSRTDRVLLVPTGFDAQSGAYRYAVNEQFGQTTPGGRGGRGGGFQLILTGRISLGSTFGAGGRGLGGGGRGGGFRGGGGRGGRLGAGGGLCAGGGGRGGGLGRVGGGRQGATLDPQQISDRALANPIPILLGLADSLGLDGGQVASIEAVSAELRAELAPLELQLRERLAGADPQAAFQALRELQPVLESGRQAIQRALEAAEAVLTEQQWDRVPAALKNPFGRGRRR